MAFPAIFGGRTTPIVDEEMGENQGTADHPSAIGVLIVPDQTTNADQIQRNGGPSASRSSSTPFRRGEPYASEPTGAHRRKRTHLEGPSQQVAADDPTVQEIDEVDHYGLRSKVRIVERGAYSGLIAERDLLKNRVMEMEGAANELTKQRDDVIVERDALVRERDALKNRTEEMDGAAHELTQQRVNVIVERDALLIERDTLRNRVEEMEGVVHERTKERDGAIVERDALASERDALKNRIEEMECAAQAVGTNENREMSLEEELSKVSGELETSKQAVAHFRTKAAKLEETLHKQKLEYEKQVKDLTARIDINLRKYAEMMERIQGEREEQNKRITADRQLMEAEIASLKVQLTTVVGQLEKTNEESVKLRTENDRLMAGMSLSNRSPSNLARQPELRPAGPAPPRLTSEAHLRRSPETTADPHSSVLPTSTRLISTTYPAPGAVNTQRHTTPPADQAEGSATSPGVQSNNLNDSSPPDGYRYDLSRNNSHQRSEDVQMEAGEDRGHEADVEDDLTETERPVVVDIKALKPPRSKPRRATATNRIPQLAAQRQTETVPPPIQFPRSNASSRSLITRLQSPDYIPSSSIFSATGNRPRPNVSSSQHRASDSASQTGRAGLATDMSPPTTRLGDLFGNHEMSSPGSEDPTPSPGSQPHVQSPRTSVTEGVHFPPDNQLGGLAGEDRATSNNGRATDGDLLAGITAAVQAGMEGLTIQVAGLRDDFRSQTRSQTPPKATKKSHPFKAPSQPRPRDPIRQQMMRHARTEMNKLLEIDADDDIIETARQHIPSLRDLESFAQGTRDPPELEPLEISWDEPNGSWNQELATKFEVMFINKHPAFRGREAEIRAFFIQRVETLQKVLNSVLPRPGEDLESATARMAEKLRRQRIAKKKRSRRVKRFQDRLETCRTLAEEDRIYDEAYAMVDRLGADGMSSDDTDGEEYSVRVLVWRALEVLPVLDHLDACWKSLGSYGNSRPGGLPRPRKRRVIQAESERDAPAGLPRNLYRPVWMTSLTQLQLTRLEPTEDIPIPKVTSAEM